MNETVTDRVEEMMHTVSSYLDGLGAAERVTAQSLLEDFCWLAVQIADVKAQIDEEGPLVATHVGLKENPLIGVLTKYMTRKESVCVKIIKVLKESGKEPSDAMSEFLKNA